MPARRVSGVTNDSDSPHEPTSRGRNPDKEKETFGCPFPGCGQTYSRMEYLKRHQRKHQDVRPFQCKDCAKAFARSDVLLRHRRRCHPTPPPADHDPNSPPSMHRAYPGVPVSSSRMDPNADPNIMPQPPASSHSRKHPRQGSGSSHDPEHQGPSANRPRYEDEEEEGDDDRYGESNRYGRQNGMGNGGVYGMNGYYNQAPESSTYTPHLIPMFQQNPPYHNVHDSNHLEDASALLSMAYGEGPSPEPPISLPIIQGQRVVADDWGAEQNLNMTMETSANMQEDRRKSTGGSGAATGTVSGSGTNTTASSVDPVPLIIPETPGESNHMGNFISAMNWLGTWAKEGSTPGEGANQWLNVMSPNPSPRPPSPFNISSLLSPTGYNPSTQQEGTNGLNTHDGEDAGQNVLTILDQMAQWDVPATKANPNPERPLLRVFHQDILNKAGTEIDRSNPFYIPADRFVGCYQIPHWGLPPVRTLSLMAARTFDTVLNHFSFVHAPTFRLMDTSACLAFAICTIGGIRAGAQKWDYLLDRVDGQSDTRGVEPATKRIDGPAVAGQSWESIYKRNYVGKEGYSPEAQDAKKVEGWENGGIVRSEKTNMLVKSFSLAQGVLMTEYNVALLQALVLYHAPYFLSEDESERALANMFLGTIVSISRQIGFFNQDLEHFEVDIRLPQSEYTGNELDLLWRRWIQLETRRRTAYLVYQLDTVCALESNIPCILSPCEISYVPLPAPDTLWKAPTAEEWLKAAKTYRPMTLDEAMRRIFFLPTYGAFDAMHERADTKYYNLLNESDYGPFARVAMVITLLRGIIDVGEGKRDRGDWRDLTDLWNGCTWLRPGKKCLDGRGECMGEVSEGSLRARFGMGLEKWRQGWDFDSLCPSPALGCDAKDDSPNSGGNSGSSPGTTGKEPNACKLKYCEEALPYYWLAQALLNILNLAPPHQPGWSVFGGAPGQGVKYGEMLKSARMFTRMGEGVPVTPLSGVGAAQSGNSDHGTALEMGMKTGVQGGYGSGIGVGGVDFGAGGGIGVGVGRIGVGGGGWTYGY